MGVKKSDGVWMKTNGDVLSPYEVEITNKDASDECLVADKDTDYKHKIVDCNLKFSVRYFFILVLNFLILNFDFSALLHSESKLSPKLHLGA